MTVPMAMTVPMDRFMGTRQSERYVPIVSLLVDPGQAGQAGQSAARWSRSSTERRDRNSAFREGYAMPQ